MKQIPMLDLKREYEYMKADIDAAIRKCLDHQKWILGPEVKELEDKIAEYIGVKHCIGVSSGTEALVLSLRALALKLKGKEYFDKSDKVITTPFTFTATGDAILRAGATPVFVDIDPVTYNIDPIEIRKYLTRNSKLKTQNSTHVVGIIPVHLYGQPCNMNEIMKIANEYNLFVIEDVAQAFGGTWNGSKDSPQKLGSVGMAGTFSFFPSKNLGGFGDGGMISTNDDQIAEVARMLLKHGGKDKYNVDHIGYNARLDTLQAAILLAKFKYVDEFNERRQKIAEVYNQELSGIKDIILPTPQLSNPSTPYFTDDHVFHQYTIRVNNGKRDELMRYLKDKCVSTMVYYPVPLHKMKVFEGRYRMNGDLKESESVVHDVLSLPVEPLMGKEMIMKVVETIKEYFKISN
ncbi:MAG: DegT/DnrJ/EryC1/StrS family aminotransferase [Candidatus Kuenenia sp.]|nr:DegT/DnrJ/EryC1/StrS family aminotransferase [Candidatus Kuenenia hertensis]